MRPDDGSDPAPHYPTASDGLGRPTALHPYRDVVGVWLRDPLGPDDLAQLQSLCGGKLGHRIRKPRFRRDDRPDLEYAQRLTLRQPTAAALEYLGKRNDVLLVYSELALDRIYDSRDDQQAALQFVIEHSLIRDRRGQFMRVCLGPKGLTLYSGQRGSKHLAVTYADKKSKVAKSSVPPLHDERRTQGPQAHRRKGISTLADLLRLDEQQFWNQHQHYYRVHDVEGLGRAYLNYLDRQENPTSLARRKAKLKRIGNTVINIDKRMGHQLIRTLGSFRPAQITLSKAAKKAGTPIQRMLGYWSIHAAHSIQNLYDRLNHIIPLDRFISRISVDANSEMRCSIRGPDLKPPRASGRATPRRMS
ncbi:hypothetical protein KMZ29_02570 [Bradyrhizobium sediminis]|uniref:Uncharacterized protein n=1 Tax=Bradyrhizobium sediminis TaxID=2840469 RepID=A0A975NFL6_9BRAD|nr:hypothetical protein [Bradyrhizobium sediminis]QWG13641.1 hypothetical protein KMZ29_02570 [Bradyrhizobium sediminis]